MKIVRMRPLAVLGLLPLVPSLISASPIRQATRPTPIHRQTETLVENIIPDIPLQAGALPTNADATPHAHDLTAALVRRERRLLRNKRAEFRKLRATYYEVADIAHGISIEFAVIKRTPHIYDIASSTGVRTRVDSAVYRKQDAPRVTYALLLINKKGVRTTLMPLVSILETATGIKVAFSMNGMKLNARVSNPPPDFVSRSGFDLLTRGALPLKPEPQFTGSQGDQGLQGGWAIDNKGNPSFRHSLVTQYGFMQGAGAGWVRINFRLGSCFADWVTAGCNGKTAVDTYTQVIRTASQNNLKVLSLLSNETWRGGGADWTANNAEHSGGTGDNPYLDSFAEKAAGVLASQFATQISQWEVWNEPDVWTASSAPGVYSGGSFMYPSNFAWLLKRSYLAIKTANPLATVISGGIDSHDGATGASYLDDTYASGIKNAGWVAGAYPLDAVGQHLYIDQGGITSADSVTAAVQDVRRAYTSYEGADTSKLTYITEIGWTTSSVSPAIQAENLQLAYTTVGTISYVGRVYWFSVQDIPEAHLAFGIVDTNGVPKPTFAAYRQYASVPIGGTTS